MTDDMPGFISADKILAKELPVNVDMPLTVGVIEDAGWFAEMKKDMTKWSVGAQDHVRDVKVKELDDLTHLEKFIVMTAIQNSSQTVSDKFGRKVNGSFVVNLQQVTKARRAMDDKLRKRCYFKEEKEHTTYMRIKRAAEMLDERGIASVRKGEKGLIWISIERILINELAAETRRKMEAAAEAVVNLIKANSEIQTPSPKCAKTKKIDPYAIPRNASGERLEAIKMTIGTRQKMAPAMRADLAELFVKYNTRVTEKIVTLLDIGTKELIGTEYSTRFNDLRKSVTNLDKFDAVYKNSLEICKKASFLTLTTDPKLFKNIWEANRHLGEAWNKFLSWLKKKNEDKRPKYLVAYEYTQKGFIHLHAIIFMERLADYKEISKQWQRCGQGQIIYVYNLYRKKVSGEWTWQWYGDRRPPKATAHGAGEYIKKYLKKAALAGTEKYEREGMVQSLYWTFNKRFWTCSRSLLPDPEEPVMSEEDMKRMAEHDGYAFFRVLSEQEAEDLGVRIIYHRAEAKKKTDDATSYERNSECSREVTENAGL
jgi:hypothetical protein